MRKSTRRPHDSKHASPRVPRRLLRQELPYMVSSAWKSFRGSREPNPAIPRCDRAVLCNAAAGEPSPHRRPEVPLHRRPSALHANYVAKYIQVLAQPLAEVPFNRGPSRKLPGHKAMRCGATSRLRIQLPTPSILASTKPCPDRPQRLTAYRARHRRAESIDNARVQCSEHTLPRHCNAAPFRTWKIPQMAAALTHSQPKRMQYHLLTASL